MKLKPWHIAQLSLLISLVGSLPIIAITGFDYLGEGKLLNFSSHTMVFSGLIMAIGLIGFLIGIKRDKEYLERTYGKSPSGSGLYIQPFFGFLKYYDERKNIVEQK